MCTLSRSCVLLLVFAGTASARDYCWEWSYQREPGVFSPTHDATIHLCRESMLAVLTDQRVADFGLAVIFIAPLLWAMTVTSVFVPRR